MSQVPVHDLASFIGGFGARAAKAVRSGRA
jgi:hypothetical protein